MMELMPRMARVCAILGLFCLAAAAPAFAQTSTFGSGTLYDNGSDTPAVALADLNGDKIPDLIAATCDNGIVAVRFNDGAGNFNSAPDVGLVVPDSGSAFGLVVADFNGDGSLDIATGDDVNDAVTIFLN